MTLWPAGIVAVTVMRAVMTCTIAVLEFVLTTVFVAVAESDEFTKDGLIGMPVKVDVAKGDEEVVVV
jgi:hypothetical protein